LQHVTADHELGSLGIITIARQPDGKEVGFADLGMMENKGRSIVIAVSGQKNGALAEALRQKGIGVVGLPAPEASAADLFKNYFHTYNRTPSQETVADIKVVATHLRERFPKQKIVLLADGEGGFGALAAAPLVDAVIADAGGLDESNDQDLLEVERFFPGLRRVGSAQGMAALAAPNPLFVHNIKAWRHDWLTSLYAKKSEDFRTQEERASDEEIVKWIEGVAGR
jgi:hypothetical protein